MTTAKFKRKYCKILQMHKKDFKNFKECTTFLHFKQIPYAKVVELQFSNFLTSLKYKLTHDPSAEFINVNLKNQFPRRCKEIGQQYRVTKTEIC
jgi:hypothetical protein